MIGRLSSFVSPCVLDISWISNSPTWQFCHLLGLTWLVLEITSQYSMLCLLSLFISMPSCHNHPGTLDLSGWTPCSPTSSGSSPWLFCFAPHYSPPASKLASGKSYVHITSRLPNLHSSVLVISILAPRTTILSPTLAPIHTSCSMLLSYYFPCVWKLLEIWFLCFHLYLHLGPLSHTGLNRLSNCLSHA